MGGFSAHVEGFIFRYRKYFVFAMHCFTDCCAVFVFIEVQIGNKKNSSGTLSS